MNTNSFIAQLKLPKNPGKTKKKHDLREFHSGLGRILHSESSTSRNMMDVEHQQRERQQAPTGAIDIVL